MQRKIRNKESEATVKRDFTSLIADVKNRILYSQTRAMVAVNSELVRLHWDIGQIIDERQKREGWGAAIIPRLAKELHDEQPEIKGFSERNIRRMLAFYRYYPDPNDDYWKVHSLASTLRTMPPTIEKTASAQKVPQPVAQLQNSIIWSIPWAHHVILMEKIDDNPTRCWYMQQILVHGWSRNVLSFQIEGMVHTRHGKAITNFDQHMPPPRSDLARQTLKDPYIFDFLTLTEPFHERELELSLVSNLEKFLLELGSGFAFIGRQYRLDVGKEDYYIDLLFYHLRLRAFVVIDLKKGKFRPEYAGKLNFYCSVINDRLRSPMDQPTIGLILCETRNELLVEYSFAGIDKPIGISTYELTRAIPEKHRSVLPTVEEIEEELGTLVKRRRSSQTKREGQK